MLIRMAVTITCGGEPGRSSCLDPQRAVLPERAPRHVEQIGDAQYLSVWNASALVCSSAANPGARPPYAARCRACSRTRRRRWRAAARQPGRQREEHAGAGRDDDDQRGEQEVEAQLATHPCPPGRMIARRSATSDLFKHLARIQQTDAVFGAAYARARGVGRWGLRLLAAVLLAGLGWPGAAGAVPLDVGARSDAVRTTYPSQSTVEERTFFSRRSQRTMPYFVYVPPGYDADGRATRSSTCCTAWPVEHRVAGHRAARAADHLIQAGTRSSRC